MWPERRHKARTPGRSQDAARMQQGRGRQDGWMPPEGLDAARTPTQDAANK